MRYLFLLTLFFQIGFYQQIKAQIISDTVWLNKPHFKITTSNAIFLYDKAGGGFSSIFDVDGNDWIRFNETGNDQYPASAAGRFRGLPNFVFRSNDSGAGHPGFEQCDSKRVSETEIVTTSKSGLWQWRWKFSDTHAQVTMEKVDSNHAYWFLYEGTPGGSFKPKKSYWGTDTRKPLYLTPDYYKGDKIFENINWVFFGRIDIQQVFFIKMLTPDSYSDTFAYLGNSEKGIDSENGMTVFGFGRQEGAKPLMTRTNNTFVLGFYPKGVNTSKQYKKFSKFIGKLN